jgi:glutathione synthase/RimK-type ligase-like ATP-grasp enzyme
MIAIVSSGADEHATAVLGELKKLGADAVLLDLSQFPQNMHLALEYTGTAQRNYSLQVANTTLNLADCKSVWWRRPQSFVLHPELSRVSYRNFAFNESYEAFSGLWQSLDTFWVNHPTKDEIAHRKVYQLRVAQEVGLTIPNTLVTNDPTKARDFVANQGCTKTIYKAFSATMQDWRETRLLKPDELTLIDQVRYAPVIFQEYIEAACDLRVTVVGQDIFAAAIYSQETSYQVDFRMDFAKARIEAVCLPSQVESQLHALMARLGLVYGAIDMRLTPDGRYVFLEINPAGQWLFIESRSGQSITAKLAKVLASQSP